MRSILNNKQNQLFSIYLVISIFSYIFFLRLSELIPLFLVFLPGMICLSQRPWAFFKNPSFKLLALAFGFEVVISLFFYIAHRPADFYFVPFWMARMAFLVFWAFTIQAAPKLQNLEYLLKVLTLAFVLHAVLTWLMFFFPQLRSLIFSTQYMGDLAKVSYDANKYTNRLPSIGAMFFGGGAFYGTLVCLLLAFVSENSKKIWPWIAAAGLFITGVFIARTALIGLFVGFGFLLNRHWKMHFSRASQLILALLILLFTLSSIPKTNELVKNAIEPFAFDRWFSHFVPKMELPSERAPNSELVLSSTQPTVAISENPITTTTILPSAILASTSTSEMIQAGAHAIETTNPKTWILGVGKVFSEKGYYGDVDIGYLRLLYYGGIAFCTSFFIPVFLSFWHSRKIAPPNRLQIKILLAILTLQLVFNIKGIIDLSVFYIAFALFQEKLSPQKS